MSFCFVFAKIQFTLPKLLTKAVKDDIFSSLFFNKLNIAKSNEKKE